MTTVTVRLESKRDLLGNVYFWPEPEADRRVGSALMWNPDTQRLTLVLNPFEPSDAVLTQFIRITNPKYDSAGSAAAARAKAVSFFDTAQTEEQA